MNKLKNLAILLIVTCSLSGFAQKTYYVSPTTLGDDSNNNGLSAAAPYRTINKALQQFNTTEGGFIYLLEGIFTEEVLIDNQDGIHIKAFNNANVVFDGTTKITSTWLQHNGNIFKTPVSKDIWQLFINDKEKVMARWPNTSFTNDAIFENLNWAEGDANAGSNGVMVDKTDPSIGDITTIGDIQDALVIANVGSFRTYVKKVTSNVTNKTFTYETVSSFKTKEHFYFLEGKLSLLDTANEWFMGYEGNQRYLYAWSATGDGTDLNNSTIKGKTQSYAFDIRNLENVTVSDLKFFATTVRIQSGHDVTINDNVFSYPNCSKRMLGVKSSPLVTSIDQNLSSGSLTNYGSTNCTFEGNVFEYTDGEGLILDGNNHRVLNNYFHHIDYSCAELQGIGLSVYCTGSNLTFDNNIIHTTGASATLNLGDAAKIRYNDISNTGLAQSDGSIVQITKNIVEGSETAYNWLHDTGKYGFRFDAEVGNSGDAGIKGLAHHNVIWNLGDHAHNSGGIGMMIKGEYQEIYNNTCFDNLKIDINILEENIGDGLTTNMHTITRNNAADRISNHRTQVNTFPGVQSNNTYAGVNDSTNDLINGLLENTAVVYDADKVIENRALYDFRPKASSTNLIDQGLEITSPVYSSVIVDITEGFAGTAPDRGAYEYNGDKWISGIDFTPTVYPWTWPDEGDPQPPVDDENSSGFINHHTFEHEDAGNYWSTTGSGINGSITSDQVHGGANAYTILAPNDNWDGVDNKTKQNKAVVLSDLAFNFSPDFTSSQVNINVSFWIKVDQDQDNGALDRIKIVVKDASEGALGSTQVVVGDPQGENYLSATSGWKQITTTFQNATYLSTYTTHIELWLGNLSGNVYVDDFESVISDGDDLSTDTLETVDVSIYPQPISKDGTLHINTTLEIEATRVYSLYGQLISQNTGNINELNLNRCEPGMYILQIQLKGNHSITKKIIIH